MPKHAKLETSRGGVGFQSTYSLSCEGFLQAGMKLHVCLFATNDFFPPGWTLSCALGGVPQPKLLVLESEFKKISVKNEATKNSFSL